ncbi:cytochrome b [Lichenihabitans sp. Uapishka_5]|uniref:cytochrome b n=1 Tax=Lichenihabitans sp. Uapishka_5 TaxID=3037302 RepID=UPI0029E80065|nr:cytochrome b [Lichenihabitans sp. Uapishka_5]MDX7952393.1 cytochrome b [Lichenihabitans sp. Uapishka_5]
MPETLMNPPASAGRYTAVAQVFHWLMAGLMFAVLPLAWVMINMPRTAETREDVYTLHKSVGLTILALAVVRLAWRARHPAPPLPRSLSTWERVSSHVSHWLLYLILFGMPVSGYMISAAGGHPVTYFWLFTVPGLPRSDAVVQAGIWLHAVTGQWLVYALIVTHVLATAWHVAVRRDGILDRMMPAQRAG